MKAGTYHIENGSLFVELTRLRFKCDRYEKWDISYYFRPSMTFALTERGVRLYPERLTHWIRSGEQVIKLLDNVNLS